MYWCWWIFLNDNNLKVKYSKSFRQWCHFLLVPRDFFMPLSVREPIYSLLLMYLHITYIGVPFEVLKFLFCLISNMSQLVTFSRFPVHSLLISFHVILWLLLLWCILPPEYFNINKTLKELLVVQGCKNILPLSLIFEKSCKSIHWSHILGLQLEQNIY